MRKTVFVIVLVSMAIFFGGVAYNNLYDIPSAERASFLSNKVIEENFKEKDTLSNSDFRTYKRELKAEIAFATSNGLKGIRVEEYIIKEPRVVEYLEKKGYTISKTMVNLRYHDSEKPMIEEKIAETAKTLNISKVEATKIVFEGLAESDTIHKDYIYNIEW